MSETKPDALNGDELDELDGEELPDRKAMTLLPVGVDPFGPPAIPIDPTIDPPS